ncbi:MAG: hypothetical protein JWQ11_336 [Rhizobacter sp.]|nr:hypothetical protein [Rhizobacter sp.]
MLETLKRWLRRGAIRPDWKPVSAWAKSKGYEFKGVRDSDGFVVEGSTDGKPWRLEWGPSQRAYITGQELRIRMEAQLPQALQMMVLNRTLMDRLESDTFERYTETLQTHIDSSAPEEMRWLAMFPKVNLVTARPMRGKFGAVASLPSMATAWVDGPLLAELEKANTGLLKADPAFVLMTLRGRLYLRLALAQADLADITQSLAVFEAALSQSGQAARVISSGHGDRPAPVAPPWPTPTGSSEPGTT